MKINLDIQFNDEKGSPIQGLTLGELSCQALLAVYKAEALTGEDKHKRYKLWQRIKDGGECELKVDEVALIKDLIGQGAIPIVSGQAWDLLEGN